MVFNYVFILKYIFMFWLNRNNDCLGEQVGGLWSFKNFQNFYHDEQILDDCIKFKKQWSPKIIYLF